MPSGRGKAASQIKTATNERIVTGGHVIGERLEAQIASPATLVASLAVFKDGLHSVAQGGETDFVDVAKV